MFNYNVDIEDKQEFRNSNFNSDTTTNNSTIDTLPLFNRLQSLNFNPGNIYIPGTLFGASNIKTTLSESFKDDGNIKNITYISSQNITSKTDTTQRISKVKQYSLNLSLRPFNLFNLDGSISTSNEYHSQNLIASNIGTTTKTTLTGKVNLQLQPLSFLTVSPGYSRTRINQYQSNNINQDINNIYDSYKTNDGTFKDMLYKKDELYQLKSNTSLFSFVDLIVGISKNQAYQVYTTSSNITTNEIIQESGSAGLGIKLFDGMNLKYEYVLKRNFDNGTYQGKGYNGITTVSYQPFKSKNMNIQINYSRTDVWGKDLNKLDQTNINQGTGTTVRSVISEQHNFTEKGSLSVNIKIPITQSPYVDSLTITAEGHIKKVWDKFDINKNINNGDLINSYDISGLTLKGTLKF